MIYTAPVRNVFYVPERDIMHLSDSPWFLISFVFCGFYGGGGGQVGINFSYRPKGG